MSGQPTTTEEFDQEIEKTIAGGGQFMHNMVGLLLSMMSELDKEAADAKYQEIKDRGVY